MKGVGIRVEARTVFVHGTKKVNGIGKGVAGIHCKMVFFKRMELCKGNFDDAGGTKELFFFVFMEDDTELGPREIAAGIVGAN